MPGTKTINHHAAGHAQDLMKLATTTYRNILKGIDPTQMETEKMLRFANALRGELKHGIDTLDPFLTEGPKSDVAKLPTVQVPSVEKPVEKQKSGFLGR